MAKHMIVSHLDSSKSEICVVKYSKIFLARYKEKNQQWVGDSLIKVDTDGRRVQNLSQVKFP